MTISKGRLGLFALLGFAMLGSLPLAAQDEPAADAKASAPRVLRRVPIYFGQVGLTPDQREQIYLIRGKYQDQLAELKRQMAELQAKELSECEAVLTDAQRKLLELRRASRRGTAAPAASSPAPASTSGDGKEPG